MMGLGFIIPLFPIYIAEKGASNFELGLIASGFTFSQFLVQPFFGGLSDRFGQGFLFLVGAAGLTLGIWASLYPSPRRSKAARGSFVHPVGPEQVEIRRKFVIKISNLPFHDQWK
jgi:MFS family permease